MNAAAAPPISIVRTLLREACAERSTGSVLLGAMILSRLVATGRATPVTFVILAFNVVVWPQLVYRLGVRKGDAYGVEPAALLVDAFVAGAWATWLHFPVLACAAFYATTVVTSVLGLGARAAGKAVGVALVGAAAMAVVHGVHIEPDVDGLTGAFALTTVLGYVTYIAYNAQLRAVALRRTRRGERNERVRQERFVERLRLYVPMGVADAIVEGSGLAMHTPRKRELTVFSSEIVDLMAIVREMEPEDLLLFLNEYVGEMSRIAVGHGGVVDRFIGDALLVFFGGPGSRGPANDASACIAMAVEMQERLEVLRPRWRASFGIDPHVRMGVDTGWCMAADQGWERCLQHTAIGPTVLVARRVQEQCPPDEVRFTEDTYKYVVFAVGGEPRGALRVAGRAEAVQTYAVPEAFRAGLEAAG